jgi:CO/xanthine dehydrogenase Mo-binding subunit
MCASPTRRRAAPIALPGRFEASFVRERLVDAIADRLGLDPIAVRRTNFIAERGDAVQPRL